MPFTRITQCNRRIEGHQGCIIPFGHDDLVLGVWTVVLGRWFGSEAVGNEDMWDSGVLEVIGDIKGSVVEFENGNDPKYRNDRGDHDTGESKVGEDRVLACLMINESQSMAERGLTCQGDLVTLMYTTSNQPFAKKTVTAALKHKRG